MTSKDGFALKLASLAVLLGLAAGCSRGNPAPEQRPPAESPAAGPVARVNFNEIDLTGARLTVTRDGPPPTPREVLRLTVKLAEDTYSRSQGLMGIDNLPSSAGMVFLYNRPVQNPFHMKNTLIPLDIAFWGEDRKIHQIMTMTPCKAEPCRLYQPKAEFIGALEVKEGLLKEKGVKVGDTVTVTVQTTAEQTQN